MNIYLENNNGYLELVYESKYATGRILVNNPKEIAYSAIFQTDTVAVDTLRL